MNDGHLETFKSIPENRLMLKVFFSSYSPHKKGGSGGWEEGLKIGKGTEKKFLRLLHAFCFWGTLLTFYKQYN